MTDALIEKLASDLTPVPARAMERRLLMALLTGLALSVVLVVVLVGMVMGRPFGGAFGGSMFWIKLAYTLAFGLIGVATAPALSRPDGRIMWPLVGAAILVLAALGAGGMLWMRADFPMPMLMGATALVCPWLILVVSLPLLGVLIVAMRRFAPRSPAMAGFAAGLLSGGFGAAVYALYCAETGMLFMALWYSLGIALTAGLGALLGQRLLRW
ncbi:hypothetical protein SAMN06295905_2041 [Devosia lucknowensis]|uniref:Uncharacterized protein n=1 Tax=Devosia lucknowensis TaxID=1096929 RepID=A0A1Y6FG48_9HYPH|nr:DUF1109 domain-containing protein [Devosia lucknowensis]SMQ72120.1 hypothetical protein SAMN06295905_2041 [Devosia lucknowensis]